MREGKKKLFWAFLKNLTQMPEVKRVELQNELKGASEEMLKDAYEEMRVRRG